MPNFDTDNISVFGLIALEDFKRMCRNWLMNSTGHVSSVVAAMNGLGMRLGDPPYRIFGQENPVMLDQLVLDLGQRPRRQQNPSPLAAAAVNTDDDARWPTSQIDEYAGFRYGTASLFPA